MVAWVRQRGGILLAVFVCAVQLLALSVIVAPTANAATQPPSYGGIRIDDSKGAAPFGPPSKWAGLLGGVGLVGTGAAEVGAAGGAAEAGAAGGLICATGVGCAVLAGLAFAGLAYATRDTWMPWVDKLLNSGTPLKPGTGAPDWEVQFSSDSCGDASCAPRMDAFTYTLTSPLCTVGPGCSLEAFYSAKAYFRTADGVVHVATRSGDHSCTAWTNQGGRCTATGNMAQQSWVNSEGIASAVWNSAKLLYLQLVPSNALTLFGQAFCAVRGDKCYSTVDNSYVVGKLPGPEDLKFQVSQVCYSATLGTTIALSGTADLQGVTIPACPAGTVPDHTTVKATGTDGVAVPLVDRDWTKNYQPKPDGNPEGFPDCFDASGHLWSWEAPQACGWDVHVDGQKCVRGNALCVNWTQVSRVTPTRTECWYGPYLRPISECYFLERAYELDVGPITGPDTDGNPDTKTDPTANPSPSPSPTPTGSASPSTSPSASPSTPTDPSGTPTTGGPIPGPHPPEATPDEDQCWPSGWGMFNPASWVLRPTKCALKWAFLPDTAVMTAAGSGVTGDLTRVGLGPLITAVGDSIGGLGGSGSGCAGPEMDFDVKTVHQHLHPFSACSPPMSTVASFVYALTTVTVGVAGAMAVLRAFGVGFSFPFSMGKGGESE